MKTNVMRLLDNKSIPYKSYTYEGVISGLDVAEYLGENPNQVFKTLVTISSSKKYYVFLVPVSSELDLKKAASCVNEKSVEMIKSKDLLSLTGYIHGGCSPLGMKKSFKTIIDKSAKEFDSILFSAGKIGYQVEVNINDLNKILDFELYDIKEE